MDQNSEKQGDDDCVAPGASCHMFQGGSGWGIDGHYVSMVDLSEFLTLFADRTVRDKTGVKGEYDLKTTGWSDPRRRPATDPPLSGREEVFDPSGPSLFTVLEEQLGLKLAQSKRPVSVVDRVEQPTED